MCTESAMEVLRPFADTLNLYCVAIILLSVGAVLACYYTNFVFEMRLDLIGLAVVFPLVFSISSAFQRREQSLQYLAQMKANAHAIRWSFYHWMEGKFLKTTAPRDIDTILINMFHTIGDYFKSDEFSESDYLTILSYASAISWLIEVHLRRGDVPPPNISHVESSLRNIMANFELMRNIKLYRTPVGLRAYTKLFLSVFPILFAPLFAQIARLQGQIWGALVMVIMYSMVLTGLHSIQDGLEEPFDGLGIDDINFGQYSKHMAYPIITPGFSQLRVEKANEDELRDGARMFVVDIESGKETEVPTGLQTADQEEVLTISSYYPNTTGDFDNSLVTGINFVTRQQSGDRDALQSSKSRRSTSRLANRAVDSGPRPPSQSASLSSISRRATSVLGSKQASDTSTKSAQGEHKKRTSFEVAQASPSRPGPASTMSCSNDGTDQV